MAPNGPCRWLPFVSYPLKGLDPFTGRFVTTAEHYGKQHDARDGYLTRVLQPNGFADHARVVIRRRAKMRAWCGVLRPLGDPALSSTELARLARVIPALRDAVHAANLTRYGRADARTIEAILAALDQPIWLVTRRGTVAFANRAARGLEPESARMTLRAARTASRRVASSTISIGGETLEMVFGRDVAEPRLRLPRSLASVADQVVAGLRLHPDLPAIGHPR